MSAWATSPDRRPPRIALNGPPAAVLAALSSPRSPPFGYNRRAPGESSPSVYENGWDQLEGDMQPAIPEQQTPGWTEAEEASPSRTRSAPAQDGELRQASAGRAGPPAAATCHSQKREGEHAAARTDAAASRTRRQGDNTAAHIQRADGEQLSSLRVGSSMTTRAVAAARPTMPSSRAARAYEARVAAGARKATIARTASERDTRLCVSSPNAVKESRAAMAPQGLVTRSSERDTHPPQPPANPSTSAAVTAAAARAELARNSAPKGLRGVHLGTPPFVTRSLLASKASPA